MTSLCVFCGSRPGADPRYADAARDLGERVARRGVRLVFGGGRVGLMGAVADGALAVGGEVVGVIPRALQDREVAHRGLSELVVVDTMHQRKAEMAERSDAFVALPGGIGTLEELFEVWTWATLGIHPKPCALLDVGGFFAPLVEFIHRMGADGFVSAEQRAVLRVDQDSDTLLDALAAYRPPVFPHWLGAAER